MKETKQQCASGYSDEYGLITETPNHPLHTTYTIHTYHTLHCTHTTHMHIQTCHTPHTSHTLQHTTHAPQRHACTPTIHTHTLHTHFTRLTRWWKSSSVNSFCPCSQNLHETPCLSRGKSRNRMSMGPGFKGVLGAEHLTRWTLSLPWTRTLLELLPREGSDSLHEEHCPSNSWTPRCLNCGSLLGFLLLTSSFLPSSLPSSLPFCLFLLLSLI